MPAQSPSKNIRIPKGAADKLQRIMSEYGVTESGAIRILINKADGVDVSDAAAMREGILVGQAAMMKSFAAVIAWLKSKGEASAWNYEVMQQEADRLVTLLKDF